LVILLVKPPVKHALVTQFLRSVQPPVFASVSTVSTSLRPAIVSACPVTSPPPQLTRRLTVSPIARESSTVLALIRKSVTSPVRAVTRTIAPLSAMVVQEPSSRTLVSASVTLSRQQHRYVTLTARRMLCKLHSLQRVKSEFMTLSPTRPSLLRCKTHLDLLSAPRKTPPSASWSESVSLTMVHSRVTMISLLVS